MLLQFDVNDISEFIPSMPADAMHEQMQPFPLVILWCHHF
jgi:hypothetical protein